MLQLLAALAIATAPVSSPSPGDRAFSAGRFDEALAAYAVAARRDPNDFDARLGLGTLELYCNQLARARRDLDAALKARPTSSSSTCTVRRRSTSRCSRSIRCRRFT